ncbi:hypothetical protein ACP70R_009178 [Stipagrostis hirtigluma subsp. patula]
MECPPSSSIRAVLFLTLALAAINGVHPAPSVATHGEPPAVVILNLKGYGGDQVSLAVQPHDLSLAGFANRSEHWHAFPGYDHLLRVSTPLPFGSSYGDLVGGLANLPSLPLGKEPALQAIRVLSTYDPATASGDGDVEAAKRALAALKVMKVEALRLRPIREAVEKGWNSGDARVAAEHLPYIEHWDTICYELARARRSGEWDGPFTELLREAAGIHNEEEALAVVSMRVDRTMTDLLTAHARGA